MLSLKGRQDKFRLQFPKEFIPKEIEEKYTKILREQHSFINKPIEFLNETIQKIDILGFNNATVTQEFTRHGEPMMNQNRKAQNYFPHSASSVVYRAATNPESLIDKTLNVTFRHTLGYLNYFMLFESFMYLYCRDMRNKDLPNELYIDLFNHKGSVYSRIVLKDPVIDGMDMLSFDYTQPIAQSQTFNIIIKYSDFEYQFIQAESSNYNGEVE
jgi:hypothetical protein